MFPFDAIGALIVFFREVTVTVADLLVGSKLAFAVKGKAVVMVDLAFELTFGSVEGLNGGVALD